MSFQFSQILSPLREKEYYQLVIDSPSERHGQKLPLDKNGLWIAYLFPNYYTILFTPAPSRQQSTKPWSYLVPYLIILDRQTQQFTMTEVKPTPSYQMTGGQVVDTTVPFIISQALEYPNLTTFNSLPGSQQQQLQSTVLPKPAPVIVEGEAVQETVPDDLQTPETVEITSTTQTTSPLPEKPSLSETPKDEPNFQLDPELEKEFGEQVIADPFQAPNVDRDIENFYYQSTSGNWFTRLISWQTLRYLLIFLVGLSLIASTINLFKLLGALLYSVLFIPSQRQSPESPVRQRQQNDQSKQTFQEKQTSEIGQQSQFMQKSQQPQPMETSQHPLFMQTSQQPQQTSQQPQQTSQQSLQTSQQPRQTSQQQTSQQPRQTSQQLLFQQTSQQPLQTSQKPRQPSQQPQQTSQQSRQTALQPLTTQQTQIPQQLLTRPPEYFQTTPSYQQPVLLAQPTSYQQSVTTLPSNQGLLNQAYPVQQSSISLPSNQGLLDQSNSSQQIMASLPTNQDSLTQSYYSEPNMTQLSRDSELQIQRPTQRPVTQLSGQQETMQQLPTFSNFDSSETENSSNLDDQFNYDFFENNWSDQNPDTNLNEFNTLAQSNNYDLSSNNATPLNISTSNQSNWLENNQMSTNNQNYSTSDIPSLNQTETNPSEFSTNNQNYLNTYPPNDTLSLNRTETNPSELSTNNQNYLNTYPTNDTRSLNQTETNSNEYRY